MHAHRIILLLTVIALAVPISGASALPVERTMSADVPAWAPEVTITDVQTDEHGNEMTSLFVTSFDGTQIDLNVCRPAAASPEAPTPVVLSSHGWGGQKSNCLNRPAYFAAGLGFASMTQRGNGSSTGENNVMDPDLEGRDIMAVVDHLASLDWVAKDDGPGGQDPVLGSQGGSYGGGFQWVGAFTDQMRRDAPTRFNAMSVGNTWYDLRQSLAPQDVLRTVIVNGLYAAGLQNNNLAPWVSEAIAIGNATGLMVDGPAPADYGTELHQHGPAWFVEQGMQLDIPVRLTQGAGDLVFPLNDAISAFAHAITPQARDRSLLANHHGGHGIPGQVPSGPIEYMARSGETCPLPGELPFFRHTLLGEDLDLGERMRLRTVDGDCHAVDALPALQPFSADGLSGNTIANGLRGTVEMGPVLEGPAVIAGTPKVTFTSTNTGPDARLFWGLAVGTSEADARLVDAQWAPSRVELPSVDHEVTIDLGSVVVDLEEGEHLYLVASSSSDQFVAHGSRATGATLLDSVSVLLPVLQ